MPSSDTPTLDLRSGTTVWELDAPSPSDARLPAENITTDVIVVGAGITGAFIAERLTRMGRSVTVVDRHEPQRASTAASTALLLWEIDAPLVELEGRLGFENAAAIYMQSVRTIAAIRNLLTHFGDGCGFSDRPTLFLSGNKLDPTDLREELRIRQRAGIDGRFLDSGALKSAFGFDREAALLHRGSAEVHPIRLAKTLLDAAITRGAHVFSPLHVNAYDCGSEGVSIGTEEGITIAGNVLVLANGYELPPFVRADIHQIVSTWVVATVRQQPAALWPERALIWEASDPYCYMRSTADNRIVFGGADEEIKDADERDRRMGEKAATLKAQLTTLLPAADTSLACEWAGFFGTTRDGLPLIGPVPGQPRCLAAFGYGGNGITFSAIAADMIARRLEGMPHPAEAWFAIGR